MATLVLSAAGAALGGSVGGALAGVSSLALGRAAGAAFGSILDRSISGGSSRTIERGKVDRLRVMGSSEGAVLPRVFGRIRLAGQVIWSSRFLESTNTTRVGAKGSRQQVRDYSYSVSLAIALCEGEIVRVGRIWADGLPLDQSTLSFRVHTGSESQLPDPLITAIEGNTMVPAYRGTAYIVFENLDIQPFGNRIPQFNFEVFRSAKNGSDGKLLPSSLIQGVSLIPGTGEYSLCTIPVNLKDNTGSIKTTNVHNDQGVPDIIASLDQLDAELPNVKSVSLVVTWFGDDLRCNHCNLQPAVEQHDQDGHELHWSVNGISRSQAKLVSKIEGRPAFGGTPCDSAVIQAIQYLNAIGKQVLFYPFVLMDIMTNNQLSDPWSDATSQPAIPWRGRISLSVAPGQPNSPDKTNESTTQVLKFFGSAQPADFNIINNNVIYNGPNEWSFRRFILHNAFLSKASGGVSAFCIGSELPGLTQIRGENNFYPTVEALRDLARDVRLVVGKHTKIGYAADWSEYFGHHPNDNSGDINFHLDPLWSDPEIDFIGIDNYMPISDWRDSPNHIDIGYSSIYSDEYLSNNISGGEGFDWYYKNDKDRDEQIRTKIFDDNYNEDWIFKYKDLKNWWSKLHFNRSLGIRSNYSTEWIPQSKPIWFTELGCPAINKGANQPNVFQDSMSSESATPYFSNGGSDEYMQYCYLKSHLRHWEQPLNNPESNVYLGQMVDLGRIHVWAWDSRPWPDFPSRIETWADGKNYLLGHWINGRTTLFPLAELVFEITNKIKNENFMYFLESSVSGYLIDSIESVRESVNKLEIFFGFDIFESSGLVYFSQKKYKSYYELNNLDFVINNNENNINSIRKSSYDISNFVSISYIKNDFDYQIGVLDSSYVEFKHGNALNINFPIVSSISEAQLVADRLLIEEILSRDLFSFCVGNSKSIMEPGDIIQVGNNDNFEKFIINKIEISDIIKLDASKIQNNLYKDFSIKNDLININSFKSQSQAHVVICDLPHLPGEDGLIGPYIAVSKNPWMGSISVYFYENSGHLSFLSNVYSSAIIGEILDEIRPAHAGIWMNSSIRIKIYSGNLQGIETGSVFEWGNLAAVRSVGSSEWEIIQFGLASLVEAPGIYELSCLLRGQMGTEYLSKNVVSECSEFVLLSGGLVKIGLEASLVGLKRNILVGPSSKNYTDLSYLDIPISISKICLQPYGPVHLKFNKIQNGEFNFSWIHRNFSDTDRWEFSNQFLDDSDLSFMIQILFDNEIVFSNICYNSCFNFKDIDNKFDKKIGIFRVAQVISLVGTGVFSEILFF